MLNILLSFAQLEREVTGERKGMYMGGVPPPGYDVENRQLVAYSGEVDRGWRRPKN